MISLQSLRFLLAKSSSSWVVSTHLEKYARQIGKSCPRFGMQFLKIFELPPPSLPPLLLFWSKMLPESWCGFIVTSEIWKLGKSPQDPSPLNKKNMSTPWAISGKSNGKQDGFNKNNFCWKSPGFLVWGVLAKSNPHLLLWFARFPTLLFFWGTSTGPKRWRSLLRSLGLGSVLEKSGEIWANGIQ